MSEIFCADFGTDRKKTVPNPPKTVPTENLRMIIMTRKNNNGNTIKFPDVKIRSSLSRLQPQQPANNDDLFAMRRAVWRKQGIIVIRPDDVSDDWIRQAMINEAKKQYGPQEK
jgi:hypothetical protein